LGTRLGRASTCRFDAVPSASRRGTGGRLSAAEESNRVRSSSRGVYQRIRLLQSTIFILPSLGCDQNVPVFPRIPARNRVTNWISYGCVRASRSRLRRRSAWRAKLDREPEGRGFRSAYGRLDIASEAGSRIPPGVPFDFEQLRAKLRTRSSWDPAPTALRLTSIRLTC